MSDEESVMSPDTSPGEKNVSGVRKVNNVPLYLGGTVVVIFVALLVLLAPKANKKNESSKPNEVLKAGTSGNYASQITTNMENGIIEASFNKDILSKNNDTDIQEVKETKETKESGSTMVSREKQYLGEYEDDRIKEGNSSQLDQEQKTRIKKRKLKELENSIKSGSSVRGWNSGGSEGVNSELVNVRREIDNISNNPTEDYNQKVEKLKSLLSEASGSNTSTRSTNDESFGETVNEWELNSVVENPNSMFTVMAGDVIPAILKHGINSELPGQIHAQVSEDVYDSATGRYLLLPQGTDLLGYYSSDVNFGQSRVLSSWNRVIFPDGRSINLGSMQGSDGAGYSGYKDKVNSHFWKIYGSAFLLSGVVAGVNLSQGDSSSDTSNSQRASDALSEALGQQLGQTTTQIISKNLNVSPTLKIRPGFRINVVVNRDILFKKPYASFKY